MTACDSRVAIGPRVKPPGRNGIGRGSRRRGATVEVELNGRALPQGASPGPRWCTGPITITHEGGVITLANLFVRERP